MCFPSLSYDFLPECSFTHDRTTPRQGPCGQPLPLTHHDRICSRGSSVRLSCAAPSLSLSSSPVVTHRLRCVPGGHPSRHAHMTCSESPRSPACPSRLDRNPRDGLRARSAPLAQAVGHHRLSPARHRLRSGRCDAYARNRRTRIRVTVGDPTTGVYAGTVADCGRGRARRQSHLTAE